MNEAINASFIAALMLLVAIAGGYIAKWLRAPRIVAYIVGGVILKYLIGFQESLPSTNELVSSLSFINELALGLILFVIGGVFEAARLKATKGLLSRLSMYEILTTLSLTTVGCFLAAWTLPDMTFEIAIVVGLLLGCAAIATAPAATWFVLKDYDAKGPTTDHILVMTGINNMVSIIAFNSVLIMFVLLGWVTGVSDPAMWKWDLFLVSLGSIGLGIVLGFVLSILHSRLPLREMVLMFFATLFLLSAGDEWVRLMLGSSFHSMVVCLAMGVSFANTARDAAFFEHTLENISFPIFALFFVLAGYNLHLQELPHLGVLGVVYILLRTLGKYFGIRLSVRKLGKNSKVKESAGLGLLCQAGVVIFLGDFLVRYWENPVAVKMNAVILASVVIYELAGPFLVKHVAIWAGEVKAVTLIRPGFLKHTWISPGPELGKLAAKYANSTREKDETEKNLVAKHLMRTNVHFLDKKAKFDEVLTFIEKSRFNDFPVKDEHGAYFGMVHFRRVRDQIYNPAAAKMVTASILADTETPCVPPDIRLPDLLELFHKYNLGEIAVVEDMIHKRLIGIIEQRDLLRIIH